MEMRKDHELHVRRKKSNILLGLVLGGFVVLVSAITVVKMMEGQSMEAFDHQYRQQSQTDTQPSGDGQ